ncbi:hypothetical protein ACJ3XI_03540 [Litorimonas sp. RW-G-Af-16]|uniref:hypothetical protein n=1 Tax=Litorimonas sp. RW-G-Af-16 TaxID=3241168 RepID=UPI00390C4C12
MASFIKTSVLAAGALAMLGGCTVAKTTGKVAAFPVKAAYKTTKFAGNTVVGTTKAVGKGVWATGKGVYYIGSVPVKVTDKALDTSSKVLTVTTQAVDLTGKVVTVSRDIQAAELNAELRALKGAKGLLSVVVDAA